MSEADFKTNSAVRVPADSTGEPALDHFVLREDLRRVSVPIDQFGSWRWHQLSFALCVLLPTALAGIYFGLIAADKYAAEFRFSVRSAAQLVSGDDVVGLLNRSPGAHDAAVLPYMVADYLRSRNVARELDSDGWLRTAFSRGDADWLSRFNTAGNEDTLWRYWQSMIDVDVDRVSGLVLVRVFAFMPDDAFALAQAVARLAETMVDNVAARARRDALYDAEEELERASLRYSTALTVLRDVRNQEGTVDPKRTIEAAATTLLGVVRKKLSLERERDVNLKALLADAPQQKVLNTQIQALESEIVALTAALTSKQGDAKTAARSIAKFEKQELERRFSERLLGVAQAAYERAREESERQHVYIAIFVEPKKPEIAEYPHRARLVAFVAMCAFALWSVMMLVIAGVRDHRNIS
jgi:capsular polysaccharide transport system permease protein